MNGNRIRTLRNEKRISLDSLSKRTGISKSYLSLLERDIQKNPSIEVVGKIAAALEVDLDYIIKKEKSPHASMDLQKGVLTLEIKLSEISTAKVEQLKELIEIFKKT